MSVDNVCHDIIIICHIENYVNKQYHQLHTSIGHKFIQDHKSKEEEKQLV